MRVLRIGYLGLRTTYPEAMTGFFRDVLGLEAAGESETVTFQRLPTHRHDFVEVYSPEHSDTRMIPDGTDFVVAFVVDDIREAIARVQAAGLEMVSYRCGQRRRLVTRGSARSHGSGCEHPMAGSTRSSRSPIDTTSSWCPTPRGGPARSTAARRGPLGRPLAPIRAVGARFGACGGNYRPLRTPRCGAVGNRSRHALIELNRGGARR